MKHSASIICLAAALSFFSAPVYADEDGAFCSAKGYLAYELRPVNAYGVRGHVLRLIRFGSQRGIYVAGEAKLNSFQTHMLVCGADGIEMAGWGAGFERYSVGVTEEPAMEKGAASVARARLPILDHQADPRAKFDPTKESLEPRWLWHEPPGSYELDSADPDHQYFLVISGPDKRARGEVRHQRTATLIQKDRHGTLSGRLVLYRHTDVETID
jgi:hypothetical protein